MCLVGIIQDQIDCDILPQDVFTDKDEYKTEYLPGALRVNGEEFRALVVPYMEYITPETFFGLLIENRSKLIDKRVVFISFYFKII